MYAKWTPNTYTIAYNLNGGTKGASAPTSATYDTAFTVSTPTKSGWTFLGWDITGMDSCTHYNGSATSTATSFSKTKETSFKNLRATAGTVTFTARWQKTITLSYSMPSGWSNVPTAQSATINDSATSATFTISSTIPTKTGYTFNKWRSNDTY